MENASTNPTPGSEELLQEVAALREKVEEYKRAYLALLERCKTLEQGVLFQGRERVLERDSVTLSLLELLLKKGAEAEQAASALAVPPAPPAPPPPATPQKPRPKPTGRKPLPKELPRVHIDVLPLEVQRQGLDHFERIGEDVTEVVERRPAGLVVLAIHKGKFVARSEHPSTQATTPEGPAANEAPQTPEIPEHLRVHNQEPEHSQEAPVESLAISEPGHVRIFQAMTPELPIQGGLAGPALLADTIVKRWEDHLPLHRLERVYGREKLELPRSTVCNWHHELASLARPLVDAMWRDALNAAYLCVDATGVLVQEEKKCRRGHFFVVIAPERHVLFGYSAQHNSAAVDKLLKGFKGYLIADAHTVYDHLYVSGEVIECGCWAHCRRYFFKSLESDPSRARYAIEQIGKLFELERRLATAPPKERLAERQRDSTPLVNTFFAWCEVESARVLDETPISKAIRYARNQEKPLRRFLTEGRIPIHNNWSEGELRREAVGRKNWLFLGSDTGGDVNATFVSLIASCRHHGIDPAVYLRDLFCLLPSWNAQHVLELSPLNWKTTMMRADMQSLLAANVYRRVSMGGDK